MIRYTIEETRTEPDPPPPDDNLEIFFIGLGMLAFLGVLYVMFHK